MPSMLSTFNEVARDRIKGERNKSDGTKTANIRHTARRGSSHTPGDISNPWEGGLEQALQGANLHEEITWSDNETELARVRAEIYHVRT